MQILDAPRHALAADGNAPVWADAATGIDAILRPRSIAVIGASRSAQTIGHQILRNLLSYGYAGPVYPVNPTARAVASVRAYPSVADVPDAIDLAVIAVPKQHVAEVAAACAESGVRGLVVISAGFREVGPDGAELERELVDIVRSNDMRMVGPNCMGVLNTEPGLTMNATFAPTMPPHGHAAFLSQSGALGLGVLDYANEYGIGIAQFVSIGNKPDVSGNDLLLYWEHDPTIGVILMYVESFGNPRNFMEIASRVTRRKPIIALKAGRSGVGARAASSHTGALAASDNAVDALLAQAGVLRAGSIQELFDMAMAFGTQPLPRSRRTAVLTNSGGPGILAADAMEAAGLELVDLDCDTVDALRPHFPAEASIRNPLDMIASATPAGYRRALEALLGDANVDSVLSIFVPPLGVRQEDVAEAIVAASPAGRQKPVFTVLMGRDGLAAGRAELNAAGIPAYIFPESAARAMAALCRYGERLQRPRRRAARHRVDRAAAARVLAGARAQGRSRLDELEALELLAAYGIPVASPALARTRDEAGAIASRTAGPVALKVVSPEIVHKSDVGGVIVGITGEDPARAAFDEIVANVQRARGDARIDGVLVQPHVRGGTETIVGLVRDPAFGPIVMFGLGGIFVEAMGDVSFRLAPIDAVDASDMIDALRGAPILGGMRGRPAADRAALVDVLLRVAQLGMDLDDIVELDINPLVAGATGVVAVDARMTLAQGSGAPAATVECPGS
jgi:acetate---CoA ligase (ADP-forming)